MEITIQFTVEDPSSDAGRRLIAALRSGDVRRELPGLECGVKKREASATVIAGSTSTD